MKGSRLSSLRGARVALAIVLGCVFAGCGTLSVSEEEELGEQAARELERELVFVTDSYVQQYVEDLGVRILAAAGPQPHAFRFHVVRDDSLNAFALPAGYIYLNTAILQSAADVSELAGVMAHEVGHVVKRHVAENYRRQRNTGLLTQLASLAAAIFVGGSAAAGGQMLGELAAVAYVNTFTREAEVEADDFAVDVLPRAGFDPRGLVSFFETLRAQGGPHMPEMLSSHPATESRIAHANARIAAAALPPNLVVHDDGRLQLIQRRLELLEAR